MKLCHKAAISKLVAPPYESSMSDNWMNEYLAKASSLYYDVATFFTAVTNAGSEVISKLETSVVTQRKTSEGSK